MSSNLSYKIESDILHIYAEGTWRLKNNNKSAQKQISNIQADIVKIIQNKSCSKVKLYYIGNKNNEEDWDSLLLSFYGNLIFLTDRAKLSMDLTALPVNIQNLLNVKLNESKKDPEPDNSILYNIGNAVTIIPSATYNSLEFLGEVTSSFGRFLVGKAKCSARDIWQEMYISSAASLPIISLVSLLLGLILAFVSALQLRNLGAELYVASLVTISMVRVMGPVLTGIVVAGKTGASYAATIGTMQVNEEIDALKTFGISAFDFLVLPRVLALSLMMPFLTMYSNCMGVLGGFLVAVFGMDISPAAFVENVQFMGSMSYLWVGLFHSFIFGIVIALSGCYQGIKCGRSAEAVGKSTTNSVVNSIIGIIVSTSIITIILSVTDL